MKEYLHCHVGEIVELHERGVKSMFPPKDFIDDILFKLSKPQKVVETSRTSEKICFRWNYCKTLYFSGHLI